MSIQRPICVLIAALGGQGGGVLADWLVTAARIDGLQAQATSIPGVAQRTGATTYYFEVYPQRDLVARPVFSIFPASGAIDLMVSLEPMEAARALSGGYISQNTKVITARERIYSTFEKIKPGNGVTPLAPIFEALGTIAGALHIVKIANAARNAKCHPNAVIFGAMSASAILPMQPASCRKAISQSGVAVESNLAGFEAGMDLFTSSFDTDNVSDEVRFDQAPDEFVTAVMALPEAVQPIAGHGAAHLLDYQDTAYVEKYLERLRAIVFVDDEKENYRLTALVARRLAAWMAFEDIIRVAQLKTRPGRLKRIRNDLKIGDDVAFYVHDYLKPGREELRGMLPKPFSKWVPVSRADRHRSGVGVKINTSGPLGWGAMRLLSKLRPYRPRTSRFEHEQAMINQWLDAITKTARTDYELACNLADLAVWARGYGDTRDHGFEQLEILLSDSQNKIKQDKKAFAKAVSHSIDKANSEPDKEVV